MAPRSSRDETPQRREQRRRTHRYTDSTSELISTSGPAYPESASPSPTKSRPKKTRRHRRQESESENTKSTSNALSAASLAQLDSTNHDSGWSTYDGVRVRDREPRVVQNEEEEELLRRQERRERRERRRRERALNLDPQERDDDRRERRERREKRERRRVEGQNYTAHQEPRKRRVTSGTYLEQGPQPFADDDDYNNNQRYLSEKQAYKNQQQHLSQRGGTISTLSEEEYELRRKRRKRWMWVGIAAVLLILAIAIPVGVVLSKKSSESASSTSAAGSASNSTKPSNSNLKGMSESDIPKAAQGTILDPFTWYDTTDFNVTYTDATVGGLSVMGLNTTWNDKTKANDNVPALDTAWKYGTMPIRGVNLGGWLSIEPLISPSLFNGFTTRDNVIDEYTLTSKLGASKAASTLEQHYSSFVTEQTFQEIQDAGFDHVRIPFSYWAVTTYDGDPYVPKISWRYLLRGIEWARKYGLRINLDLHAAPGSQNGWNHSGRQGPINWLNGTDGTLNGQRTLDIHGQLSQFFAQPRYKNIVTMYGLVNEPRMTYLDVPTVLNWTTSAIDIIRKNNVSAVLIFGDGFRGLDNWQGELQNYENLLLDVHQYVIFNVDQIAYNHSDKVNFACGGWTAQALRSEDKTTGFGPTLCGEWSQADTDCATYLNNVGTGSRWEGTLNMASTPGGSSDGSVLSPTCPTKNNPRCSCTQANADPSSYSDTYKQWLLDFAEAQMHSFEQGWGWFYWTWQTESSPQWSYKQGLAAGVLPPKAYQRSFNCSSIPDYAAMGLEEFY